METLNIFEKYETKSNYHEDQLTLNYLLLLKYSKYSQIQLINYLIKEMKLKSLGIILKSFTDDNNDFKEIKTQISTKQILNYTGRLISVLITDDKIELNSDISNSERFGILDGVIITEDDFIIAIENKPLNKNVWIEQLSFKFPDDLEYEKTPIVLSWREIIKLLNNVIQNNLTSSIEKVLIEDFLHYVYDYYPFLNPFDSFKICKDIDFLLEKRCITIMEKMDMGSVSFHKGWGHSLKIEKPGLKEVKLYHEKNESGWELNLDIFPGDTMNQSREFYSTLNEEKFLELTKSGWNLKPNFHFSYQASGLLWTNTSLSVENYISYWISKIKNNELNQVVRADWQKYLNSLLKSNILTQDDIRNFEDTINCYKYPNLNICPGVGLKYKWAKAEVLNLDNKNTFVNTVKKLIEEVLLCW